MHLFGLAHQAATAPTSAISSMRRHASRRGARRRRSVLEDMRPNKCKPKALKRCEKSKNISRTLVRRRPVTSRRCRRCSSRGFGEEVTPALEALACTSAMCASERRRPRCAPRRATCRRDAPPSKRLGCEDMRPRSAALKRCEKDLRRPRGAAAALPRAPTRLGEEVRDEEQVLGAAPKKCDGVRSLLGSQRRWRAAGCPRPPRPSRGTSGARGRRGRAGAPPAPPPRSHPRRARPLDPPAALTAPPPPSPDARPAPRRRRVAASATARTRR